MRLSGVARLACALVSTSWACTQEPAEQRARSSSAVNIAFILLDAVRRDHLTPYGYAKDTTPFLASVAARGVVFENAYAPSTWTPSSMASIFTSLYVNQHGVLTGYRALQRAHLYGESSALKNVSSRLGFDRGFNRFWMQNRAGGEALNAKLREWRPELRPAQKYFLYVHYNDAHAEGRNKLGHPAYRKRKPWYDESVPLASEIVEAYDSNLAYLDQRIRELFELFELERDTLVVITSDHGEEFGDHGRYGHPNQLYDELLRVPLIVYQPGRLAPRRVAEPVTTLDLLPSFREAAGGPPGPADQGVSLYQTTQGPAPQEPRTFYPMRFTEIGREEVNRKGVVRGRWKYILTLPERTEELYDREADPQERTNLAGRLPETVAELRARLESFEKTAEVHEREFGGEARMSLEQAQKLRALGYVQ